MGVVYDRAEVACQPFSDKREQFGLALASGELTCAEAFLDTNLHFPPPEHCVVRR